MNNADLILYTTGAFGTAGIDVAPAQQHNPGLVAVECSFFGKTGPWKDYLAPDLVGGSVAPTGDATTPPLKPFGELNFMVSGCYVAIAAFAALRHARRTGEGQNVHVPVHNRANPMFPTATAKAVELPGQPALDQRLRRHAGDWRLDHGDADAPYGPATGLADRRRG